MTNTPIKVDDEVSSSSRLRGIYLENFQSIKRPTYLEMNGLTFLYGPNSAGKSSIIDALRLWRYSTGAEESEYNNEALWMRNGASGAKLGLSFVGKWLDREVPEEERWFEDETLYDQPHLAFMRATQGKLIQVEYSAEKSTLKVALENQPLFEIHGRSSFDYNEDYSVAVSDDELEDALVNDRYICGRLIIHKVKPEYRELLSHCWALIGLNETAQGTGPRADVDVLQKGDQISHRSKSLIAEETDRYGIPGISLSLHAGKHARISVEKGPEIDRFLESPVSKPGQLRRATPDSRFLNAIEDAKTELDLIVAGICFQIRDLLSCSHVSGDRRTMSLSSPVYVSPDLRFLKIEAAATVHPSVGEYAKSLAERSGRRKSKTTDRDFVEHCLTTHLDSLRGYKLKVSALRVYDTAEARLKSYLRAIDEGLILRMKIQAPSGDSFGLDEVGSGISYVLPILTSLWSSDTSFIEQPELHLHPAAQCEMGDVFIAAASRGKKCVIESHSEHVLLRVLRRMRETNSGKEMPEELKLRPDQLAIYYFHPDGKGATHVIRVRVDPRGELLTDWPGGFFSERDRELFV